MKKLMFGIFAVALTVALCFSEKNTEVSELLTTNVEALAAVEINPDCPNGCYDNGPGCWCYGFYTNWLEAGPY